ncbi:MAG: aldolase [Moritella sp.]|uniref:aldolase/citrate lyase family protein n=1 Tax=Moritella sp. TaxID=78556 RepID=UPI001DA19453|nr:aldolase/citrate lyase family protein [Moritella sp.]NQZ51642.1 aldolase [Moritella sp.]
MINYIFITNDPAMASYAEKCGVTRIFVDLEVLGKVERQGHLDTLISNHCMGDVSKVKAVLSTADLIVRLNPLYSGTEEEVEKAIEQGAKTLMLPMFHCSKELKIFCEFVAGRVGVMPLVETHSAAKEIDKIVKIKGVTEIFIGLNDLHLDMKMKFMFEPLANGMVDSMIKIIKRAGIPYGFGGIARIGEGIVPGELILSEHIRLGSSSVILSRTFHRKSTQLGERINNIDLKKELLKLFDEEKSLLQLNSKSILDKNHKELQCIVQKYLVGK